MFTAHIKDIKKDTVQATGEQFLDVEVELLNGKKVVDTRKYAYPLGTSQEVITADIEKLLILTEDEAKQAELQKEEVALHATADETIEALKGSEIEAA